MAYGFRLRLSSKASSNTARASSCVVGTALRSSSRKAALGAVPFGAIGRVEALRPRLPCRDSTGRARLTPRCQQRGDIGIDSFDVHFVLLSTLPARTLRAGKRDASI